MGIPGRESELVGDHHQVAKLRVIARRLHLPVGGRVNRLSPVGGNVESQVLSRLDLSLAASPTTHPLPAPKVLAGDTAITLLDQMEPAA